MRGVVYPVDGSAGTPFLQSFRRWDDRHIRESNMVNYSFLCPFPCRDEIRVEARNLEDAINKIIKAGALRCRNSYARCHCEKIDHEMPPIPPEHLKNLVRLCVQESHDILAGGKEAKN